jgi:hypothetical protein
LSSTYCVKHPGCHCRTPHQPRPRTFESRCRDIPVVPRRRQAMRRPIFHRYLRASCFAVATCFGTLTAQAQSVASGPANRHDALTPDATHAVNVCNPVSATAAPQTVSAAHSAPLPKIPPVPQPLGSRGHGPGRDNVYFLRFDEDYGYLRDSTAGAATPSYKFIPLDADRDSWLTLNLSQRLLVDHNNLNVVHSLLSSSNEFQTRTMMGADLHLGSHFRFYLEGFNAGNVGATNYAGKTSTDLGIFNAFTELSNQIGGIQYGARLGRQELWLGDGMVISNRGLSNVPASLNGIRTYADWGRGRVDIFAMVPTLYARNPLQGKLNTGMHLAGIYGSFSLPAGRLGGWPLNSSVDPFIIRYTADSNPYQSTDMLERGPGGIPHFAPGPDTRNSFGVRYYGGWGPVDFDYSGVLQTGRTVGNKVHAWMFTTQTDYVWRRCVSQPRIGISFDGGSGGTSGTAGQGETNTYQPLYDNAPYYGDGLSVSQSNMIDIAPSASIDLAHNTRLSTLYSFYYRQNQNDAIYNGSSLGYNTFNPYFRSATVRGKYIGSLPEVILHWRPSHTQLLTFTLGYFMPGSALKKIGGRNTAYVQMQSMMFF